jgi:hypothetical protein
MLASSYIVQVFQEFLAWLLVNFLLVNNVIY